MVCSPNVLKPIHSFPLIPHNFSPQDECLAVLRTGCFKYFERGGECVNGPVSLLSGIAPSPVLLANHFFSVALYSIWVMFTHPHLVSSAPSNQKPIYKTARLEEYPFLLIKSVRVVRSTKVFFFWEWASDGKTLYPVLESVRCIWTPRLVGNSLVVTR